MKDDLGLGLISGFVSSGIIAAFINLAILSHPEWWLVPIGLWSAAVGVWIASRE